MARCTQTDCPRDVENLKYKMCDRCRATKRSYESTPEKKAKIKQWHHDYNLKNKLAAFDAYGGRFCACCGESHLEFLSIDHIDGGGSKHRKEIRGNPRDGKNLYLWLKNNKYPPGFGVLCMNCNFAKGHFKDGCPHNKERLRLRIVV